MFVTKKYHNFVVQSLEDRNLVDIYQFEARIADLKDQIAHLNKLVFPSNPTTNVTHEADSVISGSEKPAELSEEEHNRLLELSRESDLLFSGNYDSDLIN